jgi:hypothetical protein
MSHRARNLSGLSAPGQKGGSEEASTPTLD